MKSALILACVLPTFSSAFTPPKPIKTGYAKHAFLVSSSRVFLENPESSSSATVENQIKQQLSTSDTESEQPHEAVDTKTTLLQRMRTRASAVFHRSKNENAEETSANKESTGILVPSQYESNGVDPLTKKLEVLGLVETEAKSDVSEEKQLLQKVKDAGIAGVISYASWEIGFWAISIPVVLFGYYEFTGHWPNLSDKEDIAKLSAEAFAFVNFARFAVPLRIGLALSTTPWIQSNIVDRFMKEKKEEH